MQQPASYQVQLEVFEGPLDLLLKLIERKQLDITKIALAEVAEGFLLYIESHPNIPPGPLASFVWVASKLVWIKSQNLLPKPPLARAEDDEEDPGDELIRRLEAYKRVQVAAKWLREREAAGMRSYDRTESVSDNPLEERVLPQGTGLEGVALARLVKLVQRRMQTPLPTPLQVDAPMRGHKITVGEKVSHLRKQLGTLKASERLPLGQDFAEAASRSRAELAVLFLAVLEIMRRNWGRVEQDEMFGEIWLERM